MPRVNAANAHMTLGFHGASVHAPVHTGHLPQAVAVTLRKRLPSDRESPVARVIELPVCLPSPSSLRGMCPRYEGNPVGASSCRSLRFSLEAGPLFCLLLWLTLTSGLRPRARDEPAPACGRGEGSSVA